MSDTPRLALPLLAAAQAQKHVTHNEALVKLDVLAHLHILDRDLSAPPAANDGDTYLVAAGATGDWAGEDGRIAFLLDGAWRFYDAFSGLTGYVADEQAIVVYTGADWQDYSALLSLQNVPLLGLGTTADASNPLSAKLNNTLFTARTVAEGGDGDLRFKLNKQTAGDTLSQLYQSGFSGRAETGLLGNDDFAIKVSPDGSIWYEAIRVDKDTGNVSFGGQLGVQSTNLAQMRFAIAEEELTGLSGASRDSTISIPNGAIVFNVSERVTTAIAGATSFSVGTAVEPGKFGSGLSTPLGGTNLGVIGPTAFYADTPVRLTAAGGSFTAGAVRIAIHYYLPQAPQS